MATSTGGHLFFSMRQLKKILLVLNYRFISIFPNIFSKNQVPFLPSLYTAPMFIPAE